MNIRNLTVAVGIAAFAVLGGGLAQADGEDLYVECPGAYPSYPTIQQAVDEAALMPGTQKIRICEGIYTENVSIGAGNSVEIFGDGTDKVTVRPVPGTAGPVFNASGSGEVRIEKLTVDGLSTMVGGVVWGIRFQETSGLIKDAAVLNIRNEDGSSQGIAVRIESTTGVAAKVRVEDNWINNYTRVGIIGNGIGVDVLIEDNKITGPVLPRVWAPNGIQVSRGAVALVKGNEVQNNPSPVPTAGAGSGIILFCGGTTAVEGNKVAGADLGVSIGDTADGKIVGNEVSDSTFDAYSLQYIGTLFGPLGCPEFPSPTTNNLLDGNKAFNSGENGVSLANFAPTDPVPPTNNRIVNTDIKNSGIDGIRAFEGAVGNFFINNQIEDSGEHDAHDDNPPTTNTWLDNDCKSPNQENQPGLCKD